jgi:1-acyl-sn-glycerol-3-phosphate acyltransferase
MIYSLLRWISGIAIHWFYRDIRITNRIAIPDQGPLLVAVNHQNALVDSLLTGWVVRRRVTMTAKATLTSNPVIALLFRILGVVPLRRASDELASRNASIVDRSRNTEAFREILDVLERNGAVLIFPEGKSHNEPRLEPLRTGLARLALKARDERRIRAVKILPLGLVFENKAVPGSDVLVNVGDVIDVDSWRGADHTALTDEISRRLKNVVEEGLSPATIHAEAESPPERRSSVLIRGLATWGRFTHELPIRVARRVAEKQSSDADQPAMRTIILGALLVFLAYAGAFAIIEAVSHSVWLGALGVTSLAVGAYWAAFEGHPRTD